MTLDEFKFNKIELDENVICQYIHESQFMEVCVELFKEIGNITIIISNIMNQDDDGNVIKLTRNEAIIIGNIVRLSKLIVAFIAEICEKRAEISDILSRCIFENLINLNYFLKYKNDNSIFDDYVLSSLKTEIKLYNDINKNISQRGFVVPIEDRMLKSIEITVSESDFKIDEVLETKKKFKSIYEKARDVFGEKSYLYLISLPSHAVHGNWQELLVHNLIIDKEGFLPNDDWSHPRPQTINAIAKFSIEFLINYIKSELVECNDKEFLLELLQYHYDTNIKLNSLHEQFLTNKQKGKIE